MATVKHPTFEGVAQEVPDDQVDAWKDQGWLLEASPEPEAAVPASRLEPRDPKSRD